MPPSSNDEDQSEIEAREAFQRKQFQESVEKVLHKDDGPYEEARAEVVKDLEAAGKIKVIVSGFSDTRENLICSKKECRKSRKLKISLFLPKAG